MVDNTKRQSERLLSVDAFRGFVVIGMIIVNTPGSYRDIYTVLLHPSWNGVSPTSLVFPFLLYIVGVSIALAYTRQRKIGAPVSNLYLRILIRCLKLFVIGVLLDFLYHFDIHQIRFAGVLQRIAVVFGLCSALFLNSRWKHQVIVGLSILLSYWALLSWVPVPVDTVNRHALESGEIERGWNVKMKVDVHAVGEELIGANLEPATNFVAWIDRRLLPGRFWDHTWDPEGILSTMPALVTCLIGMLVGKLIISIRENWQRISWLFLLGLALWICGEVWSWVFPLNKHLWTGSFVLWTGGFATMFLAGFLFVIDTLGYQKGAQPGLVFGSNAISAFVLSTILDRARWVTFRGLGINSLIMTTLEGFGLGGNLASFACSIIYALILYFPMYLLYRARIFIRM